MKPFIQQVLRKLVKIVVSSTLRISIRDQRSLDISKLTRLA